MKPALHIVLRRIRPLAPFHKVAHLRSLISQEPKRSIRRQELEAALRDIFTEEMARECPRKRGQRRIRLVSA